MGKVISSSSSLSFSFNPILWPSQIGQHAKNTFIPIRFNTSGATIIEVPPYLFIIGASHIYMVPMFCADSQLFGHEFDRFYKGFG